MCWHISIIIPFFASLFFRESQEPFPQARQGTLPLPAYSRVCVFQTQRQIRLQYATYSHKLNSKVCLSMLSAIGGISRNPNLPGFGMINDNRRRIVLMVATGAGVHSHSGMTFCDKPEKGVRPRLLCRLTQC